MSSSTAVSSSPRTFARARTGIRAGRSMLVHACLLLAAVLLFGAPAAAQVMILGPQLNAAPANGTALGRISVSGDRLLLGGDYRVVLVVAANDRRTLTTVLDGDGEFTRTVTIPSIAPASYSLELTVNNVLRDSVSFRVLAPLAISLSPSSPRAGTYVNFSVVGLTPGSLSMVYDGRTAFGPVNVTSTAYSGRMRIPTDRPASLPASVVLSANNGVGRLTSRRGSRTITVQPANTSPFARVLNATPSIPAPTPRQTLRVTGSVGTNEATATDVTVQHFWTGSDGRTLPMGAAQSAVGSNGTFDHAMRTPQIGTMSARQAVGSGQMTTVTRYRDANGVMQHVSSQFGSITSSIDTDEAIDINLTLRGSDGMNIVGARIDLQDANLDDLYPTNSNQGTVSLDGSRATATPTQFNMASDEVLGCPASIERQYTNAVGRAVFDFGLDVPQGGTNVDGSGPSPQLTIQPTTTCIPGADINSPGFCTSSDPAGVAFKLVVRARHTGYGYQEPYALPDGSTGQRERVITLATRIDRYTGHIDMEICRPGLGCESRSFERSANVTLTLPNLGTSGLTLGDPYFVNAGGAEAPIEVADASSNTVRYKPIYDLTPFRGTNAAFTPAQPATRIVEFRYDAGAGRPLASATFNMVKGTVVRTVPMSRVSGSTDCSGEGGSEIWRATLPADLNEGFRFPKFTFGPTFAHVNGFILARDTDNRAGISPFAFDFKTLDSDIAALVGTPGLAINTFRPHARRLEVVPPIRDGVAQSDAAPAEYNLPSKRSKVSGAAGYEFCIPRSATTCGAVTAVDFDHEQFSKSPASQPAGAGAGGNAAGVIDSATGTDANPWVELFNQTIPIFRWYWGIPELLSAEVFADLVVRAEYLLQAHFDPNAPLDPAKSSVDAGGRLNIGVIIGVDIDVLFGILIDAGAAIYGEVSAAVVTQTTLRTVDVDECLKFTLDFSGWLEIGCPFPNPFDPTCYIPNVEETFNILESHTGSGCGFQANDVAAMSQGLFGPSPTQAGPLSMLATPAPTTASTTASAGATPDGSRPPPVVPFPREQRRALYRTPALAFDGTGNRMVLNLDADGRLVGREGFLRELGLPEVISSGFGIRDVAVAYYSTDRAVAVWSESRMAAVAAGSPPPQLTRNSAAANQRLRYALFNGTQWLAPVNLTTGGFGEGQVKLARCKATPLQLRSGCPQKVSLAFQRNTDRTVGGDKHIFFAQFDGTDWTTPVQVDQTGDINITPSITYAGGKPVVAWVRYAPAAPLNPIVSLDDVAARNLAIRVMDGDNNEVVYTGSSTRFVAQPSIAGKTNGQIAIAYTTAGTSNYIGTRQALRLGQRSCAISDDCAFTTWQVQDHHGRPLYVERPTLNFNSAGDAVVTYRGLAVGPVPGVADPQDNLFDDDPVGIQLSRGELLQIRSPLRASFVRPLALSADAAMHFQPVAAFDPVNDEVVGLSVSVETPQSRTAAEAAASAGVHAVAQTAEVEPGIHLAMVPDLPDLFVEKISTTATTVTPSTNMLVTVTVANRGSAFTVDADQTATVRVWWDVPQTRTVTSASYSLPSIAAGAKSVQLVQVPVPTTFGTDERQTLRAAIEFSNEDAEIDGDNNEATLGVGGMPVPTSLMAVSAAGTRFVNLVWAAPTDARIAGYRVYVDDANGVPQPFGSSFNKGFADLTALYGRQRTYRVATYSARGIESELSLPVTAQPSQAVVPEDLFANGFE